MRLVGRAVILLIVTGLGAAIASACGSSAPSVQERFDPSRVEVRPKKP